LAFMCQYSFVVWQKNEKSKMKMKKIIVFIAIAAAMWQPLSAQTADTNDIVWKIKNEECYAVEFSPDSKYIASIGTQFVRVFNVEDGTIFKEFPLPESNENFTDVTWSCDGLYLAAVGNFGIKVWQTDTYTEIPIELNDGNPWNTINNAHFIQNNTQLMVSSKKINEGLIVFNLSDGRKIKSIKIEPDNMTFVEYLVMNFDVSYDNKYILAYVYINDFHNDVELNLTYLVDGNTYEILQTKIPTGNHKFFNHSNKVAVFGEYGTHKGILVWDLEKDDVEKSILTVVKPFKIYQPIMLISPNDKNFVIGNRFQATSSDTLFVYDMKTDKIVKIYNLKISDNGSRRMVADEIDLSKDDQYLVVGDGDALELLKANWNRTSIETENDPYNTITTFPDPINNTVRIEVTVLLSGIYNLEIFNEAGLLVSNIYSGSIEAGTNSYTLNTNNISSGIYFIRLFGNGLNLNKKILVNH
jgi:WD40 repeat protein